MTALKESVKTSVSSSKSDHFLSFQLKDNVKLKGFVLSRRLSHSHQLLVSVAPMNALSALVASTLRKDYSKANSSTNTNNNSTPRTTEGYQNNSGVCNNTTSPYSKYVVSLLAARYAWKNVKESDPGGSDINSYAVELCVNTRPTELAKLLKYVDVGTVIEVEGILESVSEGLVPVKALCGAGFPPLGKRWFESRLDVQHFKSKKYSYQRRNRADSILDDSSKDIPKSQSQ